MSDVSCYKKMRSDFNNQKVFLLWFTGLSGSGKTTIVNILEQKLSQLGKRTYVLDGDNLRHGINKDLGFSPEDRAENIRRSGEIAKILLDAGLIVLASFISPFREDRRFVKSIFQNDEFYEIFLDAPIGVCEERDPKGLYKKAREGKIKDFTGIGSPYERPEKPDFHLKTDVTPAEECAEYILKHINVSS